MLITGGGSGIGAATAQLVCAEGGEAMLVDANAEALGKTAKAIADQVPGARLACWKQAVQNSRSSNPEKIASCLSPMISST